MDNTVYLCELQCGLQLKMEVKVIFHSGKYCFLPLIFGPFRTRRDIRTWKERFFDEFLKTCRQLPEVENCVRSSDGVEDFDAKDKSVFRPNNVSLLAERIIDLYFEYVDDPGGRNGLSDRYYDWVATMRFDFPNQEPYVAFNRSFGPINDVAEFKIWWRQFKKAVRERAAGLGRIRFRVLRAKYIPLEEDFEEKIEDEDLYEITCWSPEIKAHEFFNGILREWLKKSNSRG